MTPTNYRALADLLKARSGIVLAADKQYLIETRLLPIARSAGIDGLDALVAAMLRPGGAALTTRVVEAMTTNETFFFRDSVPFEHLTQVMVPTLTKSRKRLRIWCAAASTGQEPYSIAMALKEMGPVLAGCDVEIVATDLNAAVLDKAKAAAYSQFEVQRGLPIRHLVKYFKQNGDSWHLDATVKGMVRFRTFNLLDNYAGLGRFDIIFCRNVLIYFDRETKTDMLERMGALLPEDGYLVLGAAETVVGLTERLRPVPDRRGLYAPAPRTAAAPVPLMAGLAPRPAVAAR